MADYYSLITKAVAGLDTGAASESRQALYDRVRAALLAELRITDPPFTEAQITREQLALEEAVRRVEAEAAQRARDARVPSFDDLEADADDLEISVEAPSMIVTGGATGRLTQIWRCTWR
jgi:hypothetical protein